MKRYLPLLLLCLPAFGQTTATLANTQVATVDRIGVNMGDITNYGTGQLLKNLAYAAGGDIPGQISRPVFKCTTGGTNSTTSWYNSTSSTYPASYFVGATFNALNATSGTSYGTGTITASTIGTSGVTFTLSPAISNACSPSAGDMLLVTLLTVPASENNPQSFYNGAGSICNGAVYDTADTSPSSSNTTQSLQLPDSCTWIMYLDAVSSNLTNTNSTLAATQVPWLNVNGTYAPTFKAKCKTVGCSLTVTISRIGGTPFLSTTVSPTYNASNGVGWTTYSYTCTTACAETGAQTSSIRYIFTSTGTVDIQDAQFNEGSTLSGNTTPFRDAVVRKLQALNPGSLRFGGGLVSAYTPQLTGAEGNIAWTANSIYTPGPLVGGLFPPMPYSYDLQLCYFLQVDCWLVVPNPASATEWTNLITWLSTQGFTSEFAAIGKRIHLEPGNEQWNFGAPGTVYCGNGTCAGYLTGVAAAAARAATGYNSAVITIVGSSWNSPNQGYGGSGWVHSMLTAATSAGHLPDMVDVAPYTLDALTTYSTSGSNVSPTGAPFLDEWAEIVNWDSVTSPPANATSVYENVNYISTTFSLPTAEYEVNEALEGGVGMTQLQMDQIQASLGNGLAEAEHVLLGRRDAGVTGPINIFALSENNQPSYNCTSGTCTTIVPPIWGIERTLGCGPGQLNTCGDYDRPLSIALQVINQAVGSKKYLMSVTQSGTPTFSYAGGQGGAILANSAVPYVNVFAFSDGTNWATIIFNNNLASAESVTLAGAGAPTGTVTQTILGNNNLITDHNENAFLGAASIAPVVTLPASTSTSGTTYSVCAACMEVLSYTPGGSPSVSATTLSGVKMSGAKIQ